MRSPAAWPASRRLVWIGQYGSARGDNADGSILFVVTAVVLGGVDINGGKGSILGRGAGAASCSARSATAWGSPTSPARPRPSCFGALLIVGVLRPVIARALALGLRFAARRRNG